MDVGLYQCSQELCTYLYEVIQRSVEGIYDMVYGRNTVPSLQESSWRKVLNDFPVEFQKETLDTKIKSLYKKTMGVYVHNVLKKTDITSVASTKTFLDTFIKTFLEHPRTQHRANGPQYFAIDNYSSQKRVVMDVLRTSLAQIASSLSDSRRIPPGYSALTAGFDNYNNSRLGEHSALTVKQSVKRHSLVRSELPRIRKSYDEAAAHGAKSERLGSKRGSQKQRSVYHSAAQPSQPSHQHSVVVNKDKDHTKSINLNTRARNNTKSIRNNIRDNIKDQSKSVRKSVVASVVPDDSVSCAPPRKA